MCRSGGQRGERPPGRPATVTDGKGNKTTCAYNTDDQPLQILTGGATTCNSSVTCTAYAYANDGDLTSQIDNTGTTSYSYNYLDVQISTQPPAGAALTVTHDPVGNVATYTDSGSNVTYGYDAANELTSLKEPSLAQSTVGYNNNAVRTNTYYPRGTTTTMTPDNSGRAQEIKATNGSTALSDYTYTYTYTQGSSDISVVQIERTRSPARSVATTTTASTGSPTRCRKTVGRPRQLAVLL